MFIFESIKSYHKALQQGTAKCEEAVQFYLNKISAAPSLNAFLHIYGDEALETAKALDARRDAGLPVGKLHGVVVGLKDVIAYKDHPLSAASLILADFVSIYNATAVQYLLDEEAIIIGHLNCDEFAMGSSNENSAYGPTLNALDHSRVPGGSSGGSAVAVQANLCMISLGSDTGGSVRQPADFCGVIGFKPGYGCISRYGLIAYASSFDQIGIFAKSVDDVRTVLEIISGPDDFDSTQMLSVKRERNVKKEGPYRIAYFDEALNHPGLDPEIKDRITGLMEALRNDGHVVDPVDFKYIDLIVPAYYVLTTAEASSNLSRYDGVKYGLSKTAPDMHLADFYSETRSKGFGHEVKRRIMLGTFVLSSGYFDAYFTKAQQVRKILFEDTKLIFSEYDYLILPTAPSTAFKIGEKTDDPISMYLADIYTVYANLVGVPAISLPLFTHSNGMPFGIQGMADQFSEVSLLEFSSTLLQQYKSYENPPL